MVVGVSDIFLIRVVYRVYWAQLCKAPPSNPPRPPLLLRGQFGIEMGSNQEIDVESMPNRPLRRRRGGRGGFEGGVQGACA